MSVDKLVDSTQLDADLTSVANAIRSKGGTSAQLAFPAGFVQAIGDIETGGGDSGAIESDYITLYYAIVTVGANSVSNGTQVIPYLVGLAGFPTSGIYYSWFCIYDNGGSFTLNNTAVCLNITTYPNNLDFYRYRGGAISSAGTTSSYDYRLKPGDRYLVVTAYKKGVPSV